MNPASDTAWLVSHAKAIGFDLCGVVPAEKFPELDHMSEWLARGRAGEMHYLADPRRADPQLAMSGIRSVVVCALNYNTAFPKSTDTAADLAGEHPRGWLSRYAWGDDYHEVLRSRLDALLGAMRERFSEPFVARSYADTGPISERIAAKYAGLGWLGRNTLLLNQAIGSWFFLAAILTTLDLSPSLGPAETPPPDLCGSCRRCIDACPTAAIVEPYVLDARRCISYLTIELRGPIPLDLREPIGNHVFGCDICQDVCPWNRRAPLTPSPQFQPRSFPAASSLPPDERATLSESLYLPRLEWLAGMSVEQYRQVFRGSPVKRTKWRGLVRNACIALGNSQPSPGSAPHARISALLRRLSASDDSTIAESALWALSRIQ